jgi:hypothetical protein
MYVYVYIHLVLQVVEEVVLVVDAHAPAVVKLRLFGYVGADRWMVRFTRYPHHPIIYFQRHYQADPSIHPSIYLHPCLPNTCGSMSRPMVLSITASSTAMGWCRMIPCPFRMVNEPLGTAGGRRCCWTPSSSCIVWWVVRWEGGAWAHRQVSVYMYEYVVVGGLTPGSRVWAWERTAAAVGDALHVYVCVEVHT